METHMGKEVETKIESGFTQGLWIRVVISMDPFVGTGKRAVSGAAIYEGPKKRAGCSQPTN